MSLYLMFIQTGLFVTAWTAVHRRVAARGAITSARKLTRLNNRLYSAASLALFLLIIYPRTQRLAQTLYHASKFYEYLDILGVLAVGGTIDLHFGFHHLTTPYLTYFRVMQHSDGWRVFAALNALHHAVMYAYFGGAGALRDALPVTGTMQLVVGLAVEAWMIGVKHKGSDDDEPTWPNVFCFGLLGAYLVLWVQELTTKFGKAADSSGQVKRQ